MVREICGAKLNPKSSFKNLGAQNTWGAEITRANTVYFLEVGAVCPVKLMSYMEPGAYFRIIKGQSLVPVLTERNLAYFACFIPTLLSCK